MTLTVSDLAVPANTATCNTTIDIVDNLAPQVICPSGITLPTNSGNCVASFTGGLTLVAPGTALTTVGQYTDNCSSPTVTYSLSGATTGSGPYASIGAVAFNKGTTAVTYTFSDRTGSAGHHRYRDNYWNVHAHTSILMILFIQKNPATISTAEAIATYIPVP